MIEARSHFFIDTGGTAITQSSSQSFGPVSGSETDYFRVTSLFTTTSKLAYAVCKSRVLIVPQDGTTDKVNLILSPISQPLDNLEIKYFVYRGLAKGDFLNGSDNVIPSGTGTSDLIDSINSAFDDFYSGGSKPTFEGSFVGFFSDTDWPDTKELEEVFSNFSEATGDPPAEVQGEAFELPIVEKGQSLGNFAAGTGGIDVVLDFGAEIDCNDSTLFSFDLGYARASEWLIDVSNTTLLSPEGKKRTREQILQFIDVAAFYGMQAGMPEVGVVRVETGANPSVIEESGENIYSNVIAPFFTRNHWYIYIHSDRNQSYNFFGENEIENSTSGESLEWGIVDTALSASKYETNGWPLLVSTTVQDPVNEVNTIFIRLVSDLGSGLSVWIKTGGSELNDFGDLGTFEGLVDVQQEESNALTYPIVLSSANILDGGNKKNISSFSQLVFNGLEGYDQGLTLGWLPGELKGYKIVPSFGCYFPLLKSPEVLGDRKVAVTFENRGRIRPIYNEGQIVWDPVRVGKVVDYSKEASATSPQDGDIIYTTDTWGYRQKYDSAKPEMELNLATSDFGDITGLYLGNQQRLLTTREFTADGKFIVGMQFFDTQGNRLMKISLGLTMSQEQVLKSTLQSTDVNPFFIIEGVSEKRNLKSPEGVTYCKYRLGLSAEKDNVVTLRYPAENIIVYTLDGVFYFTSEFSQKHYQAEVEETIELTKEIF